MSDLIKLFHLNLLYLKSPLVCHWLSKLCDRIQINNNL